MADLELDVRPLLRDGGEPFGAIMAAVSQLEPGQNLKLFTTFKPEPLFSVMANKGFAHEAISLDNGDWQVIFSPIAGDKNDDVGTSENAIDAAIWPDPAHYLDCTEMDPPEPMVQILGALEAMPQGAVLFALLGREPVFLFPQLQARGHAWVGNLDETGQAYRLMVRVGASA